MLRFQAHRVSVRSDLLKQPDKQELTILPPQASTMDCY